MFMPQPPMQLDNGQAPPTALNNPLWMKSVGVPKDGGYNDATRSFPYPNHQTPMPPFAPNMTRYPIIAPHNPAPQMPASLAQMRSLMTQFHVQQMLARMQNHSMGHAGGGRRTG